MDVSPLPVVSSASQLQFDIGVSVMSNSLDMIETMGEGMQKIMEASVTPELGQNIDIQV